MALKDKLITLEDLKAVHDVDAGEITGIKADLGDLDERVDALESGGGGRGLTDAVKTALLQLAQKVAYIDDGGQDYYDDLYDALYAITAITLNTNSISMQTIGATSQLTATTTPAGGSVTWSSSNTSVATVSSTGLVTSVAYGSATITATAGSVSATCSVVVAQATCTGITASYTQSGTVYDNASLDDLKSDLVVTASWSNGTTSTLNDADYTLSGTLTEGTSTITVTYSGKTSTFNVTVSVGYSVTNNLTNCSNTNTESKVAKGTTYSGGIYADSGYELDTVSITMGGSDITSTAYSNGIITVANVTGDIVINAVAIITPVYTSSNGYEYTKRFTIKPDSTLQNFLSTYGTMEELEELTITGTLRISNSAGSVNGNNSLNIGTYCPNIKKLVIAPTRIRYNTDLNTLKFGHYTFTGIPASLTYIQLGSVNDSVYFTNSGYFRNDGTSAGLGGNTRIGNTNGLELVVYTDSYKANGGFTGTTESTTVVKEYLYTDGSVLTA